MGYIDSLRDYQHKEPHRFLMITDGDYLKDKKCVRCVLSVGDCGDKRGARANINEASLGDSYLYCASWDYHKDEIIRAIKSNRDNQKAVLFIIQ